MPSFRKQPKNHSKCSTECEFTLDLVWHYTSNCLNIGQLTPSLGEYVSSLSHYFVKCIEREN